MVGRLCRPYGARISGVYFPTLTGWGYFCAAPLALGFSLAAPASQNYGAWLMQVTTGGLQDPVKGKFKAWLVTKTKHRKASGPLPRMEC